MRVELMNEFKLCEGVRSRRIQEIEALRYVSGVEGFEIRV